MTHIAVDAMGGDHAPRAVVEGAVEAARLNRGGIRISLLGQEEAIEAELTRLGTSVESAGLNLVPTAVKIEMDEPSTQALRKRGSTIHKAAELLKKGEVQAFVSAGNTAAIVTIMSVHAGRLKGIARPAAAACFPTLRGHTLVLDVGATVDCKPHQLYQFAVMGHLYMKHMLQVEDPAVGLLSIGEEATKGNVTTREVHKLLDASFLRFIGNLEGGDIYRGKADVVVCDGFVGNLVLKTSEGLVEVLATIFQREVAKSSAMKVGLAIAARPVRRFRKLWDYTEVGGAPMLGLDGACIISHGRSNAKSICNAIGVARDYVNCGLNETIQEELAKIA